MREVRAGSEWVMPLVETGFGWNQVFAIPVSPSQVDKYAVISIKTYTTAKDIRRGIIEMFTIA